MRSLLLVAQAVVSSDSVTYKYVPLCLALDGPAVINTSDAAGNWVAISCHTIIAEVLLPSSFHLQQIFRLKTSTVKSWRMIDMHEPTHHAHQNHHKIRRANRQNEFYQTARSQTRPRRKTLDRRLQEKAPSSHGPRRLYAASSASFASMISLRFFSFSIENPRRYFRLASPSTQ